MNNNQNENNCDENDTNVSSEYRECQGCEECSAQKCTTLTEEIICCENKGDCIKSLEEMIAKMVDTQNKRYLQILKELNNLYESYDELLSSYNRLNNKFKDQSCDSEYEITDTTSCFDSNTYFEYNSCSDCSACDNVETETETKTYTYTETSRCSCCDNSSNSYCSCTNNYCNCINHD